MFPDPPWPECWSPGKRIPTLAEITTRVAAVDQEMGILWQRMDFVRSSVRGAETSPIVWKALVVYGGSCDACVTGALASSYLYERTGG